MRVRRLTCAEWLVAGLIAVVLGLLALPALQTIRWVGHTDLTVEFVVTDATTGEPVPGAAVEIHSEGGFYEEREPRNFRLAAGPDGRAGYLCRESMCSGTSGLFTDTYAVHLPWWQFRVAAPGYEPTALTDLDVVEYRRAAKRDGPRRAKLVVPVSLHKRQARQSLQMTRPHVSCLGRTGHSAAPAAELGVRHSWHSTAWWSIGSKGLTKWAAPIRVKSLVRVRQMSPASAKSVGILISKKEALELARNLLVLACSEEIPGDMVITGHPEQGIVTVLGYQN